MKQIRLASHASVYEAWQCEELTYELTTPAGGTHRVRMLGSGRMTLVDHARDDVRRQLHYAELGGEPCPCVALLAAWRGWDDRDPPADLPEEVLVVRRDLQVCAAENRLWRRFEAARHRPGKVTIDDKAVRVREFRHFAKGLGFIGRPAADVVFRLLRWGLDVRLDAAVPTHAQNTALTVRQVGNMWAGHSFSLSAKGTIVYEDEHGQHWAEAEPGKFPGKAVAARLAWNAVNQDAHQRLTANRRSALKRVDEAAVPGLEVSYTSRRLTLQLTPGGSGLGVETATALVRKLARLVGALSRRKHGESE